MPSGFQSQNLRSDLWLLHARKLIGENEGPGLVRETRLKLELEQGTDLRTLRVGSEEAREWIVRPRGYEYTLKEFNHVPCLLQVVFSYLQHKYYPGDKSKFEKAVFHPSIHRLLYCFLHPKNPRKLLFWTMLDLCIIRQIILDCPALAVCPNPKSGSYLVAFSIEDFANRNPHVVIASNIPDVKELSLPIDERLKAGEVEPYLLFSPVEMRKNARIDARIAANAESGFNAKRYPKSKVNGWGQNSGTD